MARRSLTARDQQRAQVAMAVGIPFAVFLGIEAGWFAAALYVAIWLLVLFLLAKAGQVPERTALIAGSVVGVAAVVWCFVTILR